MAAHSICTTVKKRHAYIVCALLAGCDVITEKPMTIDTAKCQPILEAVKASGRVGHITSLRI